MNLSFAEPSLSEFIQREREFVQAQAHAGASRRGHPGSPMEPYWTRELEEAARRRFEAGERHPPFNKRVLDMAAEYAADHRWIFHGPHDQFPLHMYAVDPQTWRIDGPVFQVWLRPDGSFYAGRHRSGAWMDDEAFGEEAMDHFLTLCVVGELARARILRLAEEDAPILTVVND